MVCINYGAYALPDLRPVERGEGGRRRRIERKGWREEEEEGEEAEAGGWRLRGDNALILLQEVENKLLGLLVDL